jgi:hypothetical protein
VQSRSQFVAAAVRGSNIEAAAAPIAPEAQPPSPWLPTQDG